MCSLRLVCLCYCPCELFKTGTFLQQGSFKQTLSTQTTIKVDNTCLLIDNFDIISIRDSAVNFSILSERHSAVTFHSIQSWSYNNNQVDLHGNVNYADYDLRPLLI